MVTQYSENHNFVYCDNLRSMIGTYTVVIPTTATGGGIKSYFIQEVLFVPGYQSLNVLKAVTGTKFEFWDLTLEVPTHSTALTPSFQQIQPFQLLHTEDGKPLTHNNALTPSVESVNPMCCVVGMTSRDLSKKKSVDFFTEPQVICDLKKFYYEPGGSRTVYFRRNSKFMSGKRVNLLPVVNLRNGQAQAAKLYVSTTLRFFRAVAPRCAKGHGELVSCWNDTLKEMTRESFITGMEMCPEIHNVALTAFIKRVNPTSWCNYIPNHVVSRIQDPMMVEVVELAIKFMDCKIPNAFAVAELLHCPIEKVLKYLKIWNLYSYDNVTRTNVNNKRIATIQHEMKREWATLTNTASNYIQKRFGENATSIYSECRVLLEPQVPDNIAQVQKMWQGLAKHDVIKDKYLLEMYATTKVLFLKLNTYQNRLKKFLKVRVERCDTESRASPPRYTNLQTSDVSSKCQAERHVEDVRWTNENVPCIVTPECVPVSTWLKNMSILLLSEPWLNCDNLRREAVSTILGLDNTLLDSRNCSILRDWVLNNLTIVNILKTYGLNDRLSRALVECQQSMTIHNWRLKMLSSFHGSRNRSKAGCYQYVPESSNNKKPGPRSDLLSKGVSKPPIKNKATKRNLTTSKSSTSFKPRPSSGKSSPSSKSMKHRRSYTLSKTDNKPGGSSRGSSTSSESKTEKKTSPRLKGSKNARGSPTHTTCHMYAHQDSFCLSEAEEATDEEDESCDEEEIPGEDLEITMGYDDTETLDDYDYRDSFIDDLSIEENHSSEDSLHTRVKTRGKKVKRKTKNVTQELKLNYASDSYPEARPSTSTRSGMNKVRRYKRALESDSESDVGASDVKRVKRTNDNHQPDKTTKVFKETPALRFDRQYETLNIKKQHKAAKRRKRLTSAIKTKLDYTPCKKQLSESESGSCKEAGNLGLCIKGVNTSRIKHTHPPCIDTTDSEREGKKISTPPNTPEHTQSEKTVKVQHPLKKEDASNHPSTTASDRSPGVEDNSKHPAQPAVDSESSNEEASDLESYVNSRLDIISGGWCSDLDIDTGYFVSM